MKNYKIGQAVKFNLDHSPHSYGEGVINSVSLSAVSVTLTTSCKEFKVGDIILVGADEIIESL